MKMRQPAQDTQSTESNSLEASDTTNENLNKEKMNRFINNTIQKVSVVNGERKKIFSGRVSRYDGNTIECSGFPATIGTLLQSYN